MSMGAVVCTAGGSGVAGDFGRVCGDVVGARRMYVGGGWCWGHLWSSDDMSHHVFGTGSSGRINALGDCYGAVMEWSRDM